MGQHCPECGLDLDGVVDLEVAAEYLDKLRREDTELVRRLASELETQRRETLVQRKMRQDLEERCSQLQAEVARLKVAAEEAGGAPVEEARDPEGPSRFSLIDVD